MQNLENQGYRCYLPLLPSEKIRQGAITIAGEPLFPRYLFIQLGLDMASKSWAPIRSTVGVSRLVRFGSEPARVEESLICALREEESRLRNAPQRLFKKGDQVRLTEGAFTGVEGIFQIADGERRVLVLIELLGKPVSVSVSPGGLRQAG